MDMMKLADEPERREEPGGNGGLSRGGEPAALRRLERRQAALVRLGANGLTRISASALAVDLVREAAEALEAAAVEVSELDRQPSQLVVRAAVGALAAAVGSARTLARQSPEQRALDTGAPAEFRVDGSPEGEAGVCVAVGAPFAPWGVVIAYARQRRRFLPVEIDFLTSLGQVLAGVVERERLLELNRRSAELAGRIAGVVAHDLNNALAAIGASSSSLQAMLPDEDACTEDLRFIDDAVRRGGRLVRRLLAFSGRKADGSPCDVNAVLGEARGLLDRLLPPEIVVSVAVGGQSHPVRAASGTVEPLVIGLAMSVAEALPAGDTLRIETSHVAAEGGAGCLAGVVVHGVSAPSDLAFLVPAVERTGGRVELAADAPAISLLWPCEDLDHTPG
jgi:signal transduction histidine kinase